MPNKSKVKKPRSKAGGKEITIQGNAAESNILIGDGNQILNIQKNTDHLIPGVFEDECPLSASLDLYRSGYLARLGNAFANRHDATRVLLTFFAAVALYAGGIFGLRAIQQTPLPPSLTDLFLYIAPGEHFYYPDWNAIAFDFILNPLTVVLGVFYPMLIFEQTSNLVKRGVLQIDGRWERRFSHKLWNWGLTALPLAAGFAAIVLSWLSRYQHYVNDLYALRFYVLGLIGISTFLRTAMLVLLLHSAILLSVGASKIPLDILNSTAKPKYQGLGDACLLVNFGGILIALYALTTIYASIVKKVYLRDDFLFWESVVHLAAVMLILLYFNYRQILVSAHIRQLKEDYAASKLKADTDIARHQAMLTYLKNIPNHPVWISLGKHWLTMAAVFLTELTPLTLFIIGQNSP